MTHHIIAISLPGPCQTQALQEKETFPLETSSSLLSGKAVIVKDGGLFMRIAVVGETLCALRKVFKQEPNSIQQIQF